MRGNPARGRGREREDAHPVAELVLIRDPLRFPFFKIRKIRERGG
jgi:hypothetical protein